LRARGSRRARYRIGGRRRTVRANRTSELSPRLAEVSALTGIALPRCKRAGPDQEPVNGEEIRSAVIVRNGDVPPRHGGTRGDVHRDKRETVTGPIGGSCVANNAVRWRGADLDRHRTGSCHATPRARGSGHPILAGDI